MTSRRVPRLRAAAVVVLLSVLAAGCGSGSSGAKTGGLRPPSEQVGTVVDEPLPAQIRDLPLTTADGTRTSLGAYRGKVVMIADYLTLCEDICPMITANTVAMARALQSAGLAGKVALLEITIDPHRDDLHRMRAYQRLYGQAPPDWTLLRANPADTRRLWQHFGVFVKRVPEKQPPDHDWLTGKPLHYDLQHQDALIFLGPDGHERFVVDGNPDATGSSVPARLRRVLSPQGRHNLAHPDPVTNWSTAEGLQVVGWLTGRRIPAGGSG